MIAGMVARAIGGAYRSGKWYRCRCPVHQSRGPTLALRDGPRGVIVHCHAGCPRDDVLAELRRLGLFDGKGKGTRCAPHPEEIKRHRAAQERDRQRRIADAFDFWRYETVPVVPGTIVERY